MTRITFKLVKKKAEHHEGLLCELEELSLHQLNIEKIENLGNTCKRLRILYLQNNVISKLENLRRLKDLEYLNMTLNNLEVVQNLESCEKLMKLDLTVNHIDVHMLELSLRNLQRNEMLTDLYMTGNPCEQQLECHREVVLCMLPGLQRLDGKEVTKTERIVAKQNESENLAALRESARLKRLELGLPADAQEWARAVAARGKERGGGYELDVVYDEEGNVVAVGQDDNEALTEEMDSKAFTPALRMKMAKLEVKQEADKQAQKEASERRSRPVNPLEEAHKKLNVLEKVPMDGTRPTQRNVAKRKFELKEDDAEIVMKVFLPRFLDTSLIEVDVQPTWFQCLIKGESLLMHLAEEVKPDATRVQRIASNGTLVLSMPKLHPVVRHKPKPSYSFSSKPARNTSADPSSSSSTSSSSSFPAPRPGLSDEELGLVQASEHVQSAALQQQRKEEEEAAIARLREKREAHELLQQQRATEREASRAGDLEGVDPSAYDFDIDDVPPLM